MRIELDSDNGSPIKNSEIFIDLTDEVIAPDGSVVDGSGNIWNAQWGSSRVARYDLYGNFREQVSIKHPKPLAQPLVEQIFRHCL